jgi:hypothetical protein
MDVPHENLHADGPAAGRICPHHELCAPSSRQSGHHAGSTSFVGGDMGHPCAALWAVHDACTMRVGRPCRFRPMDSGLNKKIICYLFRIQTSNIHLSAQSSKNYEISSIGFIIL